MPISVIDAKDTQGRVCVAIVLGDDDVFLTAEGNPKSGIALQPAQAREVAMRLIALADRVERGEFR